MNKPRLRKEHFLAPRVAGLKLNPDLSLSPKFVLFLSWCLPRKSGEAVGAFPDVGILQELHYHCKTDKGSAVGFTFGLSQDEPDQKSLPTKGPAVEPACPHWVTPASHWAAGVSRADKGPQNTKSQLKDKCISSLQNEMNRTLKDTPMDNFKHWETAQASQYGDKMYIGVGNGIQRKSGCPWVPNQRKCDRVLGEVRDTGKH